VSDDHTLKVLRPIFQFDAMRLQKTVTLYPAPKAKQTPQLSLCKFAGAVLFHTESFENCTGKVLPHRGEMDSDILRQF
jgi:hypothetical protein